MYNRVAPSPQVASPIAFQARLASAVSSLPPIATIQLPAPAAAAGASASRLSLLHLLHLLRVPLMHLLRLLLVLLFNLLHSCWSSPLFRQLLMFPVLRLLEFLPILVLLRD
jgi:hypothetical protein